MCEALSMLLPGPSILMCMVLSMYMGSVLECCNKERRPKFNISACLAINQCVLCCTAISSDTASEHLLTLLVVVLSRCSYAHPKHRKHWGQGHLNTIGCAWWVLHQV